VNFVKPSKVLAAALLVFLFAVNVYRAATQSITVDEALTFNHFIAQQNEGMVKAAPFNTNLGLWMSTLTVDMFGPGEFSMRIPALLAGGLYFYVLFRLCALLFTSPAFFLLAIAVNSLNPYLLDYFSAARGYGPAVAFLTSAVYCLARWIMEEDSASWKLPLLAGAALGLSFDSHISAIFPAAALGIAFIAVFAAKHGGKFLLRTAAPMVALCAVIGLLVIVPLIQQGRTGSIDGVVELYRDGLKSLVLGYLFYKPTILTAWPPIHRLAWLTLPALFAGLLAAAARLLRPRQARENVVLLLSIATPLTFLLLWIEPRMFHHGYFAGRGLLVTCPLIFLAAPLWLEWLTSKTRPERIAAGAGSALLVFLVAVFALEWNVKSYLGWEHDAGTKTAMEILRKKRPADVNTIARMGADAYLDEGLNFYRALYEMDWLKPLTRDSPECTYDYYYVLAENYDKLKRFGLQELYRDPVARTILAEPGAEARKREAALRELGIASIASCSADVMANLDHVENSKPGDERGMLRDFMPGPAGRWRWTFERPALLMGAPKRPNTTFSMDFVLHSGTFKETGPIRLSVFVNSHKIGDKLYTAAENQNFSAPVPESALRDDGIALVETRLDKYYKSPEDGQMLGYLFLRAAFVAK
jgi:hypothetical protein